jgi:hypothetical protein
MGRLLSRLPESAERIRYRARLDADADRRWSLALGHDESPEAAIAGTARIFEELLQDGKPSRRGGGEFSEAWQSK